MYLSGVEEIDPTILLALSDVTLEAELHREIRDIIDEIDIVLRVMGQQKEAITKFVKFASQILDDNVEKYRSTVVEPEAEAESATESSIQRETINVILEQQRAFKTHSHDVVSEIHDRIAALSGLQRSARITAENVSKYVAETYHGMRQC